MAAKEIRIFLEELDRGDNSPEVLFELWNKGDVASSEKPYVEFSISVSSSMKNGVYDKVNGTADADGDNDFEEDDKQSILSAARLAANWLN
ncbi:hypothetical protein ACN079_08165 [Pseudomonas sp. ABY48]|uniref:hypothetical protein n=1 Tax=Pseudomonas sp. ABY48 TaxID=3402865 RepID=UPI003B42A700